MSALTLTLPDGGALASFPQLENLRSIWSLGGSGEPAVTAIHLQVDCGDDDFEVAIGFAKLGVGHVNPLG